MESDDLIGIGPASQLLGISASRVRQLTDDGRLSAELTSGGHRRYRPDVLRREWAQLHRPKSTATRVDWSATFALKGLSEDLVWSQLRAELEQRVGSIPLRARQILGYAITEMTNNAIDHSGGTAVAVSLTLQGRRVGITIADDGVGAFRRMADTFGYDDPADAVVDLTKGKRTTAPQEHSGEGVFFTSKAVDVFRLEANGYRFSVDNEIGDIALGAGTAVGTTVMMTLDLDTERELVAVFAAFTEGGDFARTVPRIELVRYAGEFLSRSEARRFALGLEAFAKVVLDFTGVEMVGQGFADELFRVWQANHPNIELFVVGANPGVALMINRVARP